MKEIKPLSNWDKKFIELANLVATWSKDRSTKIGAVIVDDSHRVLSVGYNGFPVGFNDNVDSRHERPQKYMYTEHGERNAIYSAARNGISLVGSTMYIPWFSCADCARAIIQSGIKKIVCEQPDWKNDEKSKRWEDSQKAALEMFIECGVEIQYY